MSSDYVCEYASSCQKYEKDAICCTFLMKLCKYYRHNKKMESNRFSESRLPQLLNLPIATVDDMQPIEIGDKT